MLRVRELRTLFLRSDTGETTESVTETELPLVLTTTVRQASSHAGEALGSGSLVVTEQQVRKVTGGKYNIIFSLIILAKVRLDS